MNILKELFGDGFKEGHLKGENFSFLLIFSLIYLFFSKVSYNYDNNISVAVAIVVVHTIELFQITWDQ